MRRARLPRGFQDIAFLNGVLACSAFVVACLWALTLMQLVPLVMLPVALNESSGAAPVRLVVGLILVYPRVFLGLCGAFLLLLFLGLRGYLRKATFKSAWPLAMLHASLNLVPLTAVLYALLAVFL